MSLNNNSLRDKLTVLIVEDNEGVGKLITKALDRRGYKTKILTSGSSAVFWVLENRDCLILMDYYLSDMNAKEVIQSLKDNNVKVPFIVMTGHGNEKLAVDMMKLGAKDFLLKEQGFLDLLPTTIDKVLLQLEIEMNLYRTKENLLLSENKFKNIFNNSTDAIFLLSETDKKIFEVNKAGYELLKTTREEIISSNFIDLHPETFSAELTKLLTDLSSDKNITYESRFLRKDRSTVFVECSSKIIDFEDSKAVLAIARDITDRKKTEELLKISEDRYQKITQTMTDYIFTVYFEDNNPVKTVHEPSCLKITGYTADEFSRNPFLWIEMVPDFHKDLVRTHARDLIVSKIAEPIEHCIIRKDKKLRWVRNTPVIHFDSKRNVIAYDGVIQDITEIRKISSLLNERDTQLRKLIDSHDFGIFVCSEKFDISLTNEIIKPDLGLNGHNGYCYNAVQKDNFLCPWCNIKNQENCLEKYEFFSPEKNKWYVINEFFVQNLTGEKIKQAIVMDITSQKKHNGLIEKFLELLQHLEDFDNISVCKINKEAIVLEFNPRFKEMLNLKNIDIIGKSLDSLLDINIDLESIDRKTIQRCETTISGIKKNILALKNINNKNNDEYTILID